MVEDLINDAPYAFTSLGRFPGYNTLLACVQILEDLMDKARNLDLPANPLDELIEGLGGTSKVAEMTGRSMRREKVDGEWTIVARCKEKGSADTVNIQERKDFMSGRSDDTLDTHLPWGLFLNSHHHHIPSHSPFLALLHLLLSCSSVAASVLPQSKQRLSISAQPRTSSLADNRST